MLPNGKKWRLRQWARTPFPSPWMIPDRSSPSRVCFAASRPGRLRADPKDALLTRGKGGCGSASYFVSHLIVFDSIAPRHKPATAGARRRPQETTDALHDRTD